MYAEFCRAIARCGSWCLLLSVLIASSVDREVTPWTIVALHRPLYSSALKQGSHLELREALEPVFAKFGVQLVLCGHDHSYVSQICVFPLYLLVSLCLHACVYLGAHVSNKCWRASAGWRWRRDAHSDRHRRLRSFVTLGSTRTAIMERIS